MWEFLKKEYDSILLVVFIGVCIWKPFIFIARAVGLGSLQCFAFGLMFVQNAFKPFLDDEFLDDKLTKVLGRISSLVLGICSIGIAVGLPLSICGGNLSKIGRSLSILLNDVYAFCQFILLVVVVLVAIFPMCIGIFKKWLKK